MTEDKAMTRLIAAIENPYTTILGHMTGRLLLKKSIVIKDAEVVLNVEHLGSGMYQVMIRNNEKVVLKKIVIE